MMMHIWKRGRVTMNSLKVWFVMPTLKAGT